MSTSNPYAALYAQKLGTPTATTTAYGGDSTTPPKPTVMQTVGQGAMDLGKGIVKGGMSTVRNIGNLEGKIPGLKSLMPGDVQDYLGPEGEKMNQPHGTMQAIGKTAEQAGEFMVPGGAEEEAATKLASMAPKLGKAAAPLARIGTSAVSSGAVNKAQGGDFSTGAALGVGGQVVGQGLKAAAPIVAETALGIPKAARAFGKTPGAAIINETRGIRPETIAASAQERLGELNPQLDEAVNRASVQPNRARGLLPAPKQELPLAPSPEPRNPKMQPMAFDAKVNPEEPMEPRSGNPMAPISEYPGVNPHYLSGSAHPELSGRIPTAQGVLIRPGATGGGPIPSELPSNAASLLPARNIASTEAARAASQNAPRLHNQIEDMGAHLRNRFDTGEPIQENITPRELLDLKRGFGEEHVHNWNPEIGGRAKGIGQQMYHALDSELDRTVPESADLNQRISSLIPVAKRAESVSRNAPTVQRALGRFGAHTGALTLGGIGALEGRREGGMPGMVAGGLTGVLAPELIASPEGQMALARTLGNVNGMKPAVGLLSQANRKKEGK